MNSVTPGFNFGPETCVIYCRISSDPTGEKAGVERQEAACRDKARSLGMNVEHVYIDNDVSATSGVVRPEFEAMLRANPETIISWHQDRLIRLTGDLEKVIDIGVPIYTVVSGTLDLATPAGRAVARTVAAWSTYEGEQKAERRRAANRQRAERGAWQFSRRPYGYRRTGGKIVIVPKEAEAIREAFAAYLADTSYQSIADEWNSKGHTTTLGYTWRADHIMELMRNPRLAGIVVYKGEEMPDVEPSWEPIIDRRTWSDFCEVKKGRKQSGAPSAGKPRHLVSGFALCAICGDRLYSTYAQRPRKKDGTRKKYRVYDCTRNRCVSIAAEPFEEFVEQLVLARLTDKKIIRALRATPDVAPLEAELAELHRNRSNVADLIGDGLLTRRDARTKLEELGNRIERAQARLNAMRAESPLTDLALARSVAPHWRKLGVIEKRRVIADLGFRVIVRRGERGKVYKDAEGRRTINPNRLEIEWIDAEDA